MVHHLDRFFSHSSVQSHFWQVQLKESLLGLPCGMPVDLDFAEGKGRFLR
jgi:hypothetical protein